MAGLVDEKDEINEDELDAEEQRVSLMAELKDEATGMFQMDPEYDMIDMIADDGALPDSARYIFGLHTLATS